MIAGAVWPGPQYIGRDLRAPDPRRVLDPTDYPGSDALDKALAGGTIRADRRAPVARHGAEVGWEKNPPHKAGFEVRRDRGGGAQLRAIHIERTAADMIGRAYFSDGKPGPPARPVCAWCHQPMTVPTRRGTEQKKYCSASHKTLATQERAKARAANQ